MRLGDFLRK